jgi:hypothetical protein
MTVMLSQQRVILQQAIMATNSDLRELVASWS